MNDLPPSQAIIRFGVFELDSARRELHKQGLKVRLQEQPFQVLQILLEHPGEVVTRQELQRRIWPSDTFVDFDRGLYNAIKKLREALGDSAESPRFIETLSRRGYRFIGSVTANDGAGRMEEGASTGEVGMPTRQSHHRRLAIGVLLLLAFGATLFGLDIGGLRQRWLIKANPQAIHSLAVLPLQNLSDDPAQEYFSDGMTDALITDLAQIGSLKVISRTSVMRYKKTDKSLPEIARELNVDGIVEGTVQRSGDRVRITAQLIHGPSDKHVWASSYEREVRDVFALERDVIGDIARQVQAKLAMEKRAPLTEPRPINPKALELYLRGNYQLNRQGRGGGDEEKRKAAERFQQAIDADPNFAPAYNGLANAHFRLLWPSSQDAEIVRTAAQRAAELDPTFSDANVTLGNLLLHSWNFRAAEDELRRAVALNPNNAHAHDILSQFLYDIGRFDEGWRESQIAQELDPNQDHLSIALGLRRDYDRAIAWLLMMLKNDPDNGYFHHDLFRSYVGKGMYKEAIKELVKMLGLFGLPETAARIHHAFAISGYRGAMQQYAVELEHLASTKQAWAPVNSAEVHAVLGDKDRAFYWLEEAYSHHDRLSVSPGVPLEMINVDPMMDPLRSDPRFKDLLHRIGLSP